MKISWDIILRKISELYIFHLIELCWMYLVISITIDTVMLTAVVGSTFNKYWWISMGTVFSKWRNSIKYLCFYIRYHLSDCCSTALCNKKAKKKKSWDIDRMAQPLLPYHYHPHMTWWDNMIKSSSSSSSSSSRIPLTFTHHSVSAKSWWMSVFTDQPTLVCPCIGVHGRTSRCLWCNGHHCGKWTWHTVQILDKAVSISHSANTLGKGMNPIILLSAMDK